jgi:hypothetical protein
MATPLVDVSHRITWRESKKRANQLASLSILSFREHEESQRELRAYSSASTTRTRHTSRAQAELVVRASKQAMTRDGIAFAQEGTGAQRGNAEDPPQRRRFPSYGPRSRALGRIRLRGSICPHKSSRDPHGATRGWWYLRPAATSQVSQARWEGAGGRAERGCIDDSQKALLNDRVCVQGEE